MTLDALRSVLRSRTVWLAIAVAVLSVLQGFVLHLPLGPVGQAAVGTAIAVAIVILRALTTVPLLQK